MAAPTSSDPRPGPSGARKHAMTMTSYKIEELVGSLTGNHHLGWTEALSLAVADLGARGGAIGLVHPGESPNILASYGEIHKITTNTHVWKFFCDCFAGDLPVGDLKDVLIGLPERAACIALRRTKDEIVGAVFWVPPEIRPGDLDLQRLLLRLFALQVKATTQAEQKEPQKLVHAPNFPPGYIVGCSSAINLLHKELRLLCRGTFPVLILGETGVGKEYVASILHSWSERAGAPFVTINCAATPHELWEAEMFGIERGVATGVQQRVGHFQRADSGTIFLDEVGEIPPAAQAKLLRVLQNQVVQQVGGTQVRVDVRVLSATNSDLLRRVEAGDFRADLYYRLAGVTLNVPSLRERREDLPLLLQHFLAVFAAEARKTIKGFTLDAFERLIEHPWPGNIREMENEVRKLVYLCPEGRAIDPSLLSRRITAPAQVAVAAPAELQPGRTLNLDVRLSELEREVIQTALVEAKGNRTLAAKLLGVTRNGLSMKMERLAIDT
jgi:DNA-binding NtrC family response regulator